MSIVLSSCEQSDVLSRKISNHPKFAGFSMLFFWTANQPSCFFHIGSGPTSIIQIMKRDKASHHISGGTQLKLISFWRTKKTNRKPIVVVHAS